MLSDKVLITGCGGMLGEAVYPYFVSRYETVLASDKILNEEWLIQLDVRDDEHLRKVFEEYQPNLVIHLAAETSLEYCETHSKIAQDTNSTATKVIAKLSEEYGAVLVYISTAGVFDGLKKGFYTEQDQPNPIMVYGQTKYEGELHALEYCTRTFVVRAGWMMGGGKRKEKKFIYKILQQIAAGKKEIHAVDDRWGTPTYTYDFAKNLFLLIQTKKYGTYHMACEGKGARYDVAKEILRICKRPDIKLTAVSSEFFSREYFAPRPPSEMMYNVNLRKLGINNMNTWKDSLQNYIENYFADYIAKPQKRDALVKIRPFIKIQQLKPLVKKTRPAALKNVNKKK
ncbi:MAG: SDR family oxidoreductase [Planctomycetota bacterium]|jgi:dTDP-4-dehydrorhamnose reductase